MKVLVTGASGLLGAHVARVIAGRGDEVTVLQRRPSNLGLHEVLGDVSDADTVRTAVAGQDAVVHLAAKVNVVGDPADYERINVGGTRTMVEAARAAGVQRFVQVSSPSVAHVGTSLVGEGSGPADPVHARGDYARTKAAAELLALGADGVDDQGHDMAVLAIRPHLVWGPGDTQLVERIVGRARSGRLPIIGPGTPLVDSTCVENAADAIVAGLDRCVEARGSAYVVTNGEPRPIGEILDAMARAGGAKGPSFRVPVRVADAAGVLAQGLLAARARLGRMSGAEVDPPITRFLVEQLSTAHWFDQRRTREALQWTPRVSFDEGMARLAAWYRAQ